MKTKGLIAIDIDGTLTAVREEINPAVVKFLQELHKERWKLLFVTGRTVDWSLRLLDSLPFDFYLSAFNGAYTMSFPEKKVIKKFYLPFDQLFQVVQLVKDEDVGIAFYAAPDQKKRSFFYRKLASHIVERHLFARAKALADDWSEVDNVMDLPTDSFSAMRLFCLPHTAKKLSHAIESKMALHAPTMKDSYNDGFSIVQITHKGASKGEALENMLHHLGKMPKVIACGDDHNDISMLKRADIAVVMADAPPEVIVLGDVIAPSAKNFGIIQGLQQACAVS